MKFALTLGLLLLSSNLKGQSDSLQVALQQLKGVKRLPVLEALADQSRNSNPKDAEVYAREAIGLASVHGDSIALERLSGLMGKLKRAQSQYDSATFYFERGLRLARLMRLQPKVAEYLNSLGIINQQQGDLTQALRNYLAALQIADNTNDEKQMGDAFNNIGFVYKLQGNYDSALLYYAKALNMREKSGDTLSLAGSYNNIGLIYMAREKYDEARSWYFKSASLMNEHNYARNLAMVYNNIGVTYENQGRFEEGRNYYYRSLDLKKKVNDLRGMASTYGNLGDNYLESGNFDEAIRFALLSVRLCEETKSLDYLITAYKILYRANEEKHSYKQAFENFKMFKTLQDSLYNERKTEQINELITKYNVEKKERENVSLKASAALHEATVTRQQIIILISVVCLIVVLVLLTFLYRLYSKSKELAHALTLQKSALETTNARLEEVLHENENMTNIMVHDLRSPMNRMLGLAQLLERESGLNENQLTNLSMMNNVIEQGRRVIDDLLTIGKKETLTFETFQCNGFLEDLIRQYAAECEKKKLSLRIVLPEPPISLHTDKEVLRRILDNLISNAIKFSPVAKCIIVKLVHHDAVVAVSVCDEGPGFSEEDRKSLYQKFKRLSARPTAGEPSTGLGLAIVKHLSDQLGAEISLISAPEQGATFVVSLNAEVVQPALTLD